MGLVESSLQRWMDADAHLGAALATPDDPWVHRNRVFLDQAIDRTRQHVGELVITGPPGTRVSLGGGVLLWPALHRDSAALTVGIGARTLALQARF
jgi:hypothetical protein